MGVGGEGATLEAGLLMSMIQPLASHRLGVDLDGGGGGEEIVEQVGETLGLFDMGEVPVGFQISATTADLRF